MAKLAKKSEYERIYILLLVSGKNFKPYLTFYFLRTADQTTEIGACQCLKLLRITIKYVYRTPIIIYLGVDLQWHE